MASARQSKLPRNSRKPVSTKTASKAVRAGTSRLTHNPSQRSSDEMMQQLVHELGQMGLKVSLKELHEPQNSPRLVTQIIPELIQKASVVPLDDAWTKSTETVERVCQHPQVHPKVLETIGLPALVQYFLTVFHPDDHSSWFTVEDAARPNKKRMLTVLFALVNIVGVSTRHDSIILDQYYTLKTHQDLISKLWDQEVNIKGMEDQQALREEQEREECAQARERLERVEDDQTVENEFNDSVLLMKKAVKRRDSIAESVRRAESEVDQLGAKLAALQAQVITEEYAGQIQQQLQEAVSERKILENEVRVEYEDLKVRVQKNEKLQDALDEMEMIARRFFKFTEEACSSYGDLKQEKRYQARRLNMIQYERDEAQEEVTRAQVEVNELKESVKRQKEEWKLKQEQQKLYRNEVQREIASMKDKLKDHVEAEESVETSIGNEEKAIKEQNHQIARLMVSARELVNKREKEIDASASEVVSKNVQVHQRFEQMRQTFQEVYGNFPGKAEKKLVPEAVRETIRQIKELLRLQARIVESAEAQIIPLPLNLTGNGGDSSEDSNKENVQ